MDGGKKDGPRIPAGVAIMAVVVAMCVGFMFWRTYVHVRDGTKTGILWDDLFGGTGFWSGFEDFVNGKLLGWDDDPIDPGRQDGGGTEDPFG